MLFTLLLAYVLIFVFYGKSLMGMKHMLKLLKENQSSAVLSLNEDGVSLVKEDVSTKTAWGNVLAIREFKENVVFIPTNETKAIISVDKRYGEKIETYIRDNEITVQFIKWWKEVLDTYQVTIVDYY